MQLKSIEPPLQEPISLEEAKLFLRVDHEDEDSIIQTLISAAREYAEGYLRQSIAIQTWEMIIDSFPSILTIPLPPLVKVHSISFVQHGEKKEIPSTDYVVREAMNQVFPLKPWPLPVEEVNILFQAGQERVPLKTKQAMFLLISTWYEVREGIVVGKKITEVPFAVKSLLSMDRRWPQFR